MAPPRAARVVAILAALLAGPSAHAAEDVIDLATETSCNRLLAEAARLTEEAYRHEGETAEQAAQEARAMLPDAFFFWPADYFLLDPGNVDAVFTALRARMLALAARSGALHCGIGFHPVPESQRRRGLDACHSDILNSGMRAWVYIMASVARGTLYVGVTTHLSERVHQHRGGLIPGFTKTYGVKMLVYYEPHDSIAAAIQREKNIKHWPRAWKIALIEGMNPAWRDLWRETME